MLRVDQAELERMESQYSGIIEMILRFENAKLPVCPRCGSEDTASVQVGVIGRTMHIAAATTKFRLLANGPKPDEYYCNACNTYFNREQSKDKSKREIVKTKKRKPNVPGGFLSRPEDKSLAAYKRWINGMADALGATGDDSTEEEWQKDWKEFWSD